MGKWRGLKQFIGSEKTPKNRTARAVPLQKSTKFGTSPDGDRATHSWVNRGTKEAAIQRVETPCQLRIFNSPG
jgi:hypothetical protein